MVPAKKSSNTKKTTKKTASPSKQASQKDTQPEKVARTEPQPPPPQEREELALPKGALMALRMSGGTNPAAREVFVYPDGRIMYDAHEKLDMRRPRVLTDARIAEIRHTLERIDFLRLPPTGGTPSAEGKPPAEAAPSGERVQIAARMGTRTNSVEYPKQNLPESLAPLVDQLSALLPQEPAGQAAETKT